MQGTYSLHVSSAVEYLPNIEEEPMRSQSLDLLDHIRRTYRLLDLVSDKTTSGSVDKVVIAQESIKKFANHVEPGSYASITKVNFRALDKHKIKPQGVYGSQSSIVKFLEKLQCISQETASQLLAPRDGSSSTTRPTLRAGLYLVDARDLVPGLCYVVFWPEDLTWQDGLNSAASRNRVTFMRYLTKLCDQIVCLIDDYHSSKLVWYDKDLDLDDVLWDDRMEDRLFTFAVEQTQNQAENVVSKEGFSFQDRCIDGPKRLPPNCPKEIQSSLLQPRLVTGEISQGILTTSYDTGIRSLNAVYSETELKDMLKKENGSQIRLDSSLDVSSTRILHDLGLSIRCGGVAQSFKAKRKTNEERWNSDRKTRQAQDQKSLEHRMQALSHSFLFWLVHQAAGHYPSVSEEALLLEVLPTFEGSIDGESIAKATLEVEKLFKRLPQMKQNETFHFTETLKTSENDSYAQYDALKTQYCQITAIIDQNRELPSETVQRLIDIIVLEDNFQQELDKVINQKRTSWFTGYKTPVTIKTPIKPHIPDDIAFWKQLQADRQAHAGLYRVEKEIRSHVVDLLGKLLQNQVESALKNIEDALWEGSQHELDRIFEERRAREQDTMWESLLRDMRDYLEKEFDHTRPCIRITHVTREDSMNSKSFRMEGTEMWPNKAGLKYTLHPFEIKADDQQQISINPGHICRPFINHQRAQTFNLLKGSTLREFCLIGRDDCLVLLERGGKLDIYFESTNAIANAIHDQSPKGRIDLESVGEDSLSAIDESKRLLALLSRRDKSLQIHVYILDENLSRRGSTIDITRWFPSGVPKFERLLFVPGTEKLLLVDNKGICRIYSLVTGTFTCKPIPLGNIPHAAFSTPDGSCLVVLDGDGIVRLRCFHWSSFGENPGVEILLPPWVSATTRMGVSSIGHRDGVHVIFLQPDINCCSSLSLTITRKSSAFAFRRTPNTSRHGRTTAHNSLIDCHEEVWTRFPIRAPIQRERSAPAVLCPPTILFVSCVTTKSFVSYFRAMVFDFEGKTRKASEGHLRDIKIASAQNWSPLDNVNHISTLYIGDWLVGMLCLIPIHLAVTASNRFNPVKDGASSMEFDRSLLGANVTQIAQALSFGWYESIFSSYLADKPVKVVTSMGEQSVGRSYVLNHFVDTSFADSAMRCMEGVWLSVTPTRDHLIVAMDFEGGQTIEHSAQEDTFLVLLNTAVSNFVLFPNNFAFSRDIAGLFSSFQSCTSMLDPALNPTLFQSRLEIIIKDVIASDTEEMIEEFYRKFDRLVQDEGGDNFITKLHQGKLDIISWPVIESAGFYKRFNNLKTRFMKQPVTHPQAGAFLVMLKTLMAKLKANDWGALDQNLATQRAHHLATLLIPALCYGISDLTTGEPLKSCDNDQPIPLNDGASVFYLPSVHDAATESFLTVEGCLNVHRKGWADRLQRCNMDENDYFARYWVHLEAIAVSRATLVHEWLKTNTSRFAENADIKILFRTFEEHVKELKEAVVPCGASCSRCALRCLHQRHHEGDHECTTNHKCAKFCAFIDQHGKGSTIPPCDMPAGHEGQHVCKIVAHMCGIPCHLEDKGGCLRKCSKSLDHEGDEHLCAATVHACGAACDLIAADGTPICTRKCVTDSRKPHKRHCCEHYFSCPVKCELCKSYCAAGDHFHALRADARHLCGKTHRCSHLCELAGICKVSNISHSVESTFVDRLDRFQYTKYTQEARRLLCEVPIEPDEIEHSGQHMHSTDPTIVHFCETWCQHCGYYCDLPLNHVQDEHHTLHGSMKRSAWAIERDDNTTLDLQGGEYASGDGEAPFLCSMVCKVMGRHVHVSRCLAESALECQEEGIEHIQRKEAKVEQDWVSHRLFWARTGFEDPYTHAEQADFLLCDRKCVGKEHDPNVHKGALPSHCTLPLFHPPATPVDAPGTGYLSHDGHVYGCKDPALAQRAQLPRLVMPSPTSVDSHSDTNPRFDKTETPSILTPANETTMTVIGAIRCSFDIMVPLSTARSDHEGVQVLLNKIHKEVINYIASVSKSFKTAESGFALAKKVEEICTTLSGGRDECSNELIHESIAEMQEIVQTAHADAKATSEMFNANSRAFTEIRAETKRIVIESKQEAEANALSWKEDGLTIIGATAAKSMAGAPRYLESAAKDLERLMAEINTVAEYWSWVITDLNFMDGQAKKLRDDRRLQMEIKGLKVYWEGGKKDFKQYINALNTLLNNSPQYNEFVASSRAVTLPKDEENGSSMTLPKDGLGSGAILPKDGRMSRTTVPKDEPKSVTNDMGCSTAEPSRLLMLCLTSVDSHSNNNSMSYETGISFSPIPAAETTMALIGATRRSFDIIAQLFTARSDYEDVQVILYNIHKWGIYYIALVSKSCKTAHSAFAIVKKAQELCTTLSGGRDKCSNELIHGSIAEMQEVAQIAHADAKTTSEMFNANRREFTKIRTDIETKRMQVIKSKQEAEANGLSRKEDGATAAKSMARALRHLESAAKDLESLMVEINTVAEYWGGVNTELNFIDDQAKKLRDDRRLRVKVKSLRGYWEDVTRDHKGYIPDLDTLLNNTPQYKSLVDSGRAITLPKDEI